jgi:hypothetical protein
MDIKYVEVGVCGLSCRLCPMYNTHAQSKCEGCKSPSRMAVGCPFITCAVKKRGIEFCWQCPDGESCVKWQKNRAASARYDSFKCYQTMEDDIVYIQKNGVEEFVGQQKKREAFLKEMLLSFDEGRSKSFYCVAVTVLALDELQNALETAKQKSNGLSLKEKAKVMHSVLEQIAQERGYLLKLRK